MQKQNNKNIEPEKKDEHIGYQNNIAEHFKRLRIKLTIGLLICFILPLVILSGYFHFQFTKTLKKSEKFNLTALSISQGNTIDLFLQERVVNLFSLFCSTKFTVIPSKSIMEYYLQNLRHASDAFIDVGFFNNQGIQIGYAGPFPFLQGKNYSKEDWFTTLINQEKQYYISDIYLGFRDKPHENIRIILKWTQCQGHI